MKYTLHPEKNKEGASNMTAGISTPSPCMTTEENSGKQRDRYKVKTRPGASEKNRNGVKPCVQQRDTETRMH